MKFAKMEIVELKNDVITTSAAVCECYVEGYTGPQDNADEC